MMVCRLNGLDAEEGNDHASQDPAAQRAWQLHTDAVCS